MLNPAVFLRTGFLCIANKQKSMSFTTFSTSFFHSFSKGGDSLISPLSRDTPSINKNFDDWHIIMLHVGIHLPFSAKNLSTGSIIICNVSCWSSVGSG